MKRTYSGDDIAAAFNRPLPSTRCANCPHQRWQHRREVDNSSGNPFDMPESFFECEEWDRRTKTGNCKCQQFTDPALPGTDKENQ